MEFDAITSPHRATYKLLTGLVAPRPIALVTSMDAAGRVNAAPFSFFNAVGSDPPLIVLGIANREGGHFKDTLANIRSQREFVVNIVSYEIVEAMNKCAIDFPPGVDEMEAAHFTREVSVAVKPPRIAESVGHLECREETTLHIGSNNIVVGRVVHIAVKDEMIDPKTGGLSLEKLDLVGRMVGNAYARTTDRFELPRPTYAQWKQEHNL